MRKKRTQSECGFELGAGLRPQASGRLEVGPRNQRWPAAWSHSRPAPRIPGESLVHKKCVPKLRERLRHLLGRRRPRLGCSGSFGAGRGWGAVEAGVRWRCGCLTAAPASSRASAGVQWRLGAQWRLGPFGRAALSSVVVCGLGPVDVGGCGAVEVGARWRLGRCGDVAV